MKCTFDVLQIDFIFIIRKHNRRLDEVNECVSEWVNEQTNERVSEWSEWVIIEFIGGYKVDFGKFKRCLTFNYCSAIKTNKVKDGQHMFWLESVLIVTYTIIITKSYR